MLVLICLVSTIAGKAYEAPKDSEPAREAHETLLAAVQSTWMQQLHAAAQVLSLGRCRSSFLRMSVLTVGRTKLL